MWYWKLRFYRQAAYRKKGTRAKTSRPREKKHTILTDLLIVPHVWSLYKENLFIKIYIATAFIIYYFPFRFESVPLVTPNGDVLIKELSFEVVMVNYLFKN